MSGTWTNYLQVTASRMGTAPNGDRQRFTRLLDIIGLREWDVLGDRLAEILKAYPRKLHVDETLGVAIYRATRDTPAWVGCVGRAIDRQGCSNCGRFRCGVQL